MDAIFVDANGNKKNFLYQYDKGQTLILEGLDYNAAPEVHFTTSTADTALISKCTYKNGTLSVLIPDALLLEPKTITVYLYFNDDSICYTDMSFDIYVRPRKKPSNYIYSDGMYFVGIGSLANAINTYMDTQVEFIEDVVVDYTTVRLTDDITGIKYMVGINDSKLYIKEVK